MVTLRELIDRFAAWLAKLDERRGKWENPLAKLTGREFYVLTGVAALGVVLLLLVAWRSGVDAGVGQLPYRAAGAATNTGGSSAYAQNIQSDLSAQGSSAGAPAAPGSSEQASP